MAYAALLSLELVIDQILPDVQDHVSFLLKENNKDYAHLCRKEELKSLHENIIFLQKVLEESPEKCITLESRITKVAYQLEDIIESSISGPPFMYFASEVENLQWTQMCSAFGTCSQQVHSIVEEAKALMKNCENEDISIGFSLATSTSSSGPPTGKDTMVGLDEDMKKILDRATGHGRGLQFIPIVGMGGIGKTTLARNVFEHSLVVQHFDIRSWTIVSQKYDPQKILLGLLDHQGANGEHVESLIVRLHKRLKGRRFLIVLDDMWDAEVCDRIMRAFPDDNNCSRIIITTRILQLFQDINYKGFIHQMEFLNEDQSWSLIREKVFGHECWPSGLETLGKQIASNCKGLPLAIVVIAGLLKGNMTQDFWKKIKRNVTEAATDASDDLFLGILSLSYDNLPHHLRACFLYMGVFPKDIEIPRDELIQLWVAEGFIKPQEGKSMEKMAKEYLEDLLRRSLVLVSKLWFSETEYFSIHDMLRESCLRKAQQENTLQDCTSMYFNENNFSRFTKGHRCIIVKTDNLKSFSNNMHASPLRSILFVGESITSLLPFVSEFKLIRKIYELRVRRELSSDCALFNLIHLKYLSIVGIRGSYLHPKLHIHASVVKLQNLQTLRLDYHIQMKVVLPSSVWRMENLRHVVMSGGEWLFPKLQCYAWGSMHSDLRCLQTLSVVRNFKFTTDAVKRLSNLKRLEVRYVYGVDCEEFGLNNLVDLPHLQDLGVYFNVESWTTYSLITIFMFPHNLRKLVLRGCILSDKMMADICYLENLEVLELSFSSFVGDDWEVTEGGFVKLKILRINQLKLKQWNVDDTHFPRLEELCIIRSKFEIPDSIGDIPTLKKLILFGCEAETVESARRIQEQQQINSNDNLQVHCSRNKSSSMHKFGACFGCQCG